MSRALSTTSYAILGMLAIQPWTPYELTRQMNRSLGRFWPRAESKLYEEPKKLVEYGFATASVESTGKRSRTRYAITNGGRAALRTWLESPVQMPGLEAEPLLRVFLAEHGSHERLVAVLEDVRRWSRDAVRADAQIAQAYLDGEGRYPRRIAQVTLVGRFLSDFALMSYRWSEWALGTVQSWPRDPAQAQADRAALTEIAARAALVDEDPAGHGDASRAH